LSLYPTIIMEQIPNELMKISALSFVNILWIKQGLVTAGFQSNFAIPIYHLAVKAAFLACVAGSAVAFWDDRKPERVLIAINSDFLHGKNVSRCLALVPDFCAGTAVKMSLPTVQCQAQGLLIHVRHHEKLARLKIRNNSRYQPGAVKARQEFASGFPFLFGCFVIWHGASVRFFGEHHEMYLLFRIVLESTGEGSGHGG